MRYRVTNSMLDLEVQEYIGNMIKRYYKQFNQGDVISLKSQCVKFTDVDYITKFGQTVYNLVDHLEYRIAEGQLNNVEPSFEKGQDSINILLHIDRKLFCISIFDFREMLDVQFEIQIYCLVDNMPIGKTFWWEQMREWGVK